MISKLKCDGKVSISHLPELHHADHESLLFSKKVFHIFILLTKGSVINTSGYHAFRYLSKQDGTKKGDPDQIENIYFFSKGKTAATDLKSTRQQMNL